MQRYIADRVVQAYDAHYQGLCRERGQPAADQWHAANEDLIAKRHLLRRRIRVGAYFLVAVIAVVSVLIIGGPIVWLLCKLGVFSLL